MKITILTFGSTGDVVPYVALALGLEKRGFNVVLAAPSNFEDYIKNTGLTYHPIYGNIQEILDSEQGKKLIASGNAKAFAKEMSEITYKNRYEMQRDTLAACEGADLIIGGTLMGFNSAIISAKLKIPLINAYVNPALYSTKEFPHFMVSAKNLYFGFLNRLSYTIFLKAYSASVDKEVTEWCTALGLNTSAKSIVKKIIKLNVPVLNGYSPSILPTPADWPDHVITTGVWKKDNSNEIPNEPSAELQAWIKNGTPPVYFGFGSMPVLDPAAMWKMVAEICEELDVRAIINAGWSDTKGIQSKDNVFVIQNTDLDWLFPQCSCIVHHGGVGTTHLSLEAGIPTLICSIFADNPFWGERITKLGVGKHIRFKELTKEKIIKALKELQNETTRKKVADLGKRLKAENGLRIALDFIEQKIHTAPVLNLD
ncbi:MAG: glycosyltransferase [Ginsengibacter sp.]